MDRGTIQGDSLSPFLFIIYLEPLLRWLRVGANGYVPGSFANLTTREQLKQQTPDITYADDLNLLADSVEKLCTQAQKVSMYADWGALRVNSTKTLLTGARYKSSPKDPYDGATLQRLLCDVRVQNAPATFHDPREPFKYLGVKFTMNLNWSAQFGATREALKELTSSMLSSYATTTQKMRTINTCLRTKVRYAFCVAPYTNGQIQMLDSILCRAVKQAYGLPTCMSNAAVHEDVNRGGLGSPSLLTEYAMVQVQRLTAALNDTGPLGALSRARMQQEKCLLDKTTAAAHPALAQHSMRLRQQLACVRVNIELRKDQTEILPMDSMNPLIQELVTISNHSTATANAVLKGIHTPDPPPLLILDYHLRIAGFRRLQDLMSNTGRGLLNIKQVELKIGKTLTGRAATAFRRVSYMLTLPPGATKDTYKSRPPAIKGQDCIHPEYARLLRGQDYIKDMDVRQATLPLLWSAQVQAASTEAAMDEIQEHIAQLINGRVPGQAKASSVRATASDITWPLTAAPLTDETGFSVYHRLTAQLSTRTSRSASQRPTRRINKTKVRKELHQLYHNFAEGVDIVAGVDGTQSAAEFMVRGIKRRRRIASQKQIIIRWEPTIMQGWMIEIAKIMGYAVQSATPVSNQQAGEASGLVTECCGPNSHITEPEEDDDLISCNICARRYHIGCLPLQEHPHKLAPAGMEETGSISVCEHNVTEEKNYVHWTCKECRAKAYTIETLPVDLKHYQVHWQPQAECEADLCERNPALAQMVADYRTNRAQQAREEEIAQAHPPRRNNALAQEQEQLTPMQKQGDYFPLHPQRYNIRLGEEWSSKFAIETNPINPHADIYPTGKHEVYSRELEMRIDGVNWYKNLACIYTPDGRCRFTLTTARAATLYHQYLHCTQHKNRLMQQLKVSSFAEELYALMCRYKDGAQVRNSSHKTGTIKVKNHWATPPEIYHALQDLMQIDKERFASPLNYNPRMAHYWSVHERDQVFGAKWDTYKYQWTGSSVHNPEYEDEDLNQDNGTAIAAARYTDEPVFGVHILPAWSDTNRTAYLQWLKVYPENCKHMLQLPRRHFRFQKPTTWEQGETYAGSPRWDVNLIVTGNKAGFAQHLPYWDASCMDNVYDTLQEAINSTLPNGSEIRDIRTLVPHPWTASHSHTATSADPDSNSAHLHTLGYPKREDYKKRRHDSAARSDPPPMVNSHHDTLNNLEAAFANMHANPPPLRHNWTDFAYTDGSCRQPGGDWPIGSPGLGAAVYMPASCSLEDDIEIPILPCGPQSMHNTINRADLIGIMEAIKRKACNIATDSLTSMFQIRKQLRRLQDQTDHQHSSLLEEAARMIENSNEKVTLYKVKGHSCLMGNEKADEIAVGVAKGHIPEESCHEVAAPSNDRGAKYWPYKIHVRPSTGCKIRRALGDLKDCLKLTCHKHCKLGMANCDTIYFQSMANIQERCMGTPSNAFMTSRKITYQERKIALAYRYGVMWTRKRAYRYPN